MSDHQHHDEAFLPPEGSYQDLLVRQHRERMARLNAGRKPQKPPAASAAGPEPPPEPEPAPRPRLPATPIDYFSLGIPRWRAVQLAVAREFGVTRDDLVGPSRVAGTVLARHVAMTIVHKTLRVSLAQTGRLFGRRDHTTVFSGIQNVGALAAVDDGFRQRLDDLTSQARRAREKAAGS